MRHVLGALALVSSFAAPASGADLFSRLDAFWTGEIRRVAGFDLPRPTLLRISAPGRTPCGPLGPDDVARFCDAAGGTLILTEGFVEGIAARSGMDRGDVEAFVLAHLFGRHVASELRRAGVVLPKGTAPPVAHRDTSALRALEANCLIGVWLNRDPGAMTPQVIERALAATQAVNDGRNGTLDERLAWFRAGLAEGMAGDCDSRDISL